ncbi:hypothetical protein F5Y19DRAFT_422920 [Xylariaceae sp. FL1651]|nr:hypothetical protein F5Y19DRAFT_422920 [Xylariaceae sp. FL1651]
MGSSLVSTRYSDECPRSSQDCHGTQDQESIGFLDELHLKRIRKGSVWQTKSCFITITLVNIILLSVSVMLLGTWYHERFLAKNSELRRVSTYSPVYDLLDLGLHTIQVNGTLLPPEEPSISRQMPNAAADIVWEDYEKVRPIPLTRSQIVRMGKDPTNVAKFEHELWGLGDDAYVGDLDVFHQLHCLNSLRKFAYAGYYNKTAIDAADGSSWGAVHINHCVDILMQTIQCLGNVGFITSYWAENQPYPQPDMSINRKCIVFDRLVAWRNAHSVDPDKYVGVMKGPGISRMST